MEQDSATNNQSRSHSISKAALSLYSTAFLLILASGAGLFWYARNQSNAALVDQVGDTSPSSVQTINIFMNRQIEKDLQAELGKLPASDQKCIAELYARPATTVQTGDLAPEVDDAKLVSENKVPYLAYIFDPVAESAGEPALYAVTISDTNYRIVTISETYSSGGEKTRTETVRGLYTPSSMGPYFVDQATGVEDTASHESLNARLVVARQGSTGVQTGTFKSVVHYRNTAYAKSSCTK